MCLSWRSVQACGEGADKKSASTEASQAIIASLAALRAPAGGGDEAATAKGSPSAATGIQKLLDLERDDLIVQEKAILEDVVTLLKEVR